MTIILDGTNGITSPGETLTGTQVLAAGTTTVAPLDFTAGTNLTTPLAGAMEYDGKVIYATPQGTQRGVVPGAQFFRLDSGLAGANVNTVQSVFGVSVTLSSSTVYEFEAVYVFTKSAGTTSHTLGIGFGGAATVNSIAYSAYTGAVNSATPSGRDTTPSAVVTNAAANLALTGAVTNAAVSIFAVVRGIVSVNAGGTFTPQYTLSAAPGGAYTTAANSYFLIYPIGASGANTSVGAWA